MKKKTLIEKSLFTLTIILGLSAIIGGMASGCYVYLNEKCGENCKNCIPIIAFVIILLLVVITYTTEHGKAGDPRTWRLQKKCGDNNARIIFVCFIAVMCFCAGSLRVLMPDSLIAELVVLVFFAGFIVFVLIPIQWLEKIKIKWISKVKKGY